MAAASSEWHGRVGVVGFCMGAVIAMLLASGHGFSAASVNDGGHLPDDIEALLVTACPIFGSYGAKDPWNRGVAAALELALKRAQVPPDIKEYPDAGHSFMNDHEVWWFKVLRLQTLVTMNPLHWMPGAALLRFFTSTFRPEGMMPLLHGKRGNSLLRLLPCNAPG